MWIRAYETLTFRNTPRGVSRSWYQMLADGSAQPVGSGQCLSPGTVCAAFRIGSCHWMVAPGVGMPLSASPATFCCRSSRSTMVLAPSLVSWFIWLSNSGLDYRPGRSWFWAFSQHPFLTSGLHATRSRSFLHLISSSIHIVEKIMGVTNRSSLLFRGQSNPILKP